MEEVLLRFPHIGEKIFESLDEKSLESCRKVCKPWKNFIEDPNQKFKWIRIIKNCEKKITLKNWISSPYTWSNLRIQNLRKFANSLLSEEIKAKMEEMFLEKYLELKIELNAKSDFGRTAFHLACEKGNSKLAEMMMKKSNELKIDLNAQDRHGQTGFHLACRNGRTREHSIIVGQILDNAKTLKINITSKNCYGRNGFQIASTLGHVQVVTLIRRKIPIEDLWQLVLLDDN